MGDLRSSLRGLSDRWLFAAHGDRFVARHRMTRRIRRGIRVDALWDRDSDLYHVVEGDRQIMVARPSRVALHWEGIAARQRQLRREYLIPDGLVRPGDLVIDCGANVGEIAIYCAQIGAEVIAFEPDPTEFRALCGNAAMVGGIHAHNKALWNETGEVEFFEANRSGDSSLIQPPDFDTAIRVAAIRLDDFDFGALADRPIRLVKLEAEGAEPEILDGMVETLSRVAFLTVDMGPERGLKQESTREDVTERLTGRGFRMVDFYAPRQIGLFASGATEWPLT